MSWRKRSSAIVGSRPRDALSSPARVVLPAQAQSFVRCGPLGARSVGTHPPTGAGPGRRHRGWAAWQGQGDVAVRLRMVQPRAPGGLADRFPRLVGLGGRVRCQRVRLDAAGRPLGQGVRE